MTTYEQSSTGNGTAKQGREEENNTGGITTSSGVSGESKRKTLAEEIWKDVVGYEGLYLVSNRGRVYSCKLKRILKVYNTNGYLVVNLCRRINFIHRLIASAFIYNPNNLPVVDHIDRNKRNNNIDNLRWVTQYTNTRNRGINSNNTSGITGVYYDKNSSKWYSQITIGFKNRCIGYFETFKDAVESRQKSEKIHYL